MNTRIVLFLDIDGVLLPFPTNPLLHIPIGRIFPDVTLSALCHILEAFPKTTTAVPSIGCDSNIMNPEILNHSDTMVDIVLSSTWRVKLSMREDIIADFRAYGRGPLSTFNDDFYGITNPKLHTERQHEIFEWLKQYHKENMIKNKKSSQFAWIAIDDEELIHGPSNAKYKSIFENHVIHCDSKVGLTHDQAVQAIELIRNQLR
jgi:hypothetical protein